MKTKAYIICLLCMYCGIVSQAQEQELTDTQLLELFDGLRVADVADGMDMVGLPHSGLLDPAIESLWKDIAEFNHHMTGIAMTVRYVPTNRPFYSGETMEGYKQWRNSWYGEISGEPFLDSIKQGTVVVIDNSGVNDAGTVGSNNSMLWQTRGSVGILAAGGVRDTDEIIKQQIPVYMDISKRGRGIRPGRNELESVNEPVEIGGVLIKPGDVIVADGDGVIVIPRKMATKVAIAAREELQVDKAARRRLYERLGLPIDFTVED